MQTLPDSVFDNVGQQDQTTMLPDDVFDNQPSASSYDPIADVMAPVTRAGQFVADLPLGALKTLQGFGNKINQYFPSIQGKSTVNYDKLLGVPNPTVADKILQGIGGMAPAALAGPLGGGLEGAGLATKLGSSFLPGSVYSAAQPGSTPGSTVAGGIANMLGAGVGHGIGSAYNALGSALDNSTNKALDSLGINLPYGERVQNPQLAHFSQNMLARVPLSGASQVYTNASNKLNQAASDTLSQMKGSVPYSEIPKNLMDAVQDTAQDITKTKNELYSNVDQRAQEVGAQPDMQPYKDALGKIINQQGKHLFNNPELVMPPQDLNKLKTFYNAIGGNFSKPDDVVSYMNALTDEGFEKPQDVIDYLNENYDTTLKNSKDLMGYANQLRPKSFANSSLTAGKLNDMAYQAGQSGNSYLAGQIRDARDGLLQGMQNGAENAGDPGLMNAWDGAQQFYKNEYAALDDPSIKPYLKSGTNPDLIVQHFVKTGAYAQPTLLNKLMSKLNPAEQQQVGYYFLSKNLPLDSAGNPIADPGAISTAYNSLNPQIRQQLFGNLNDKLGDISLVRKQIPDIYANPNTGKQGADLASYAALYGAYQAGHAMGGPAAGLAAVGSVLGGSRGINKLLTSPSIRNSLMNNKNIGDFLAPALGTGATLATNAVNSN